MNKLQINKIKPSVLCCRYCGKTYKKYCNLNKHALICEYLNNKSLIHNYTTNLDKDEDIEKTPTIEQMFEIIKELIKRQNSTQEKVDVLNKCFIKKIKKNVIEWLNTNIQPIVIFKNLSQNINIIDEDIENIMNTSFIDTLHCIFSRNIYNYDILYPICCFIQKPNVFYIYENDDKKWVELTKDNFINFLNNIHIKLCRAFYEYKKNNRIKIENDENFSDLCDKTTTKLMSVVFNNDTTYSKIKNAIFIKMKTDIKAVIEYEFEF